jgi:hypothetical protein
MRTASVQISTEVEQQDLEQLFEHQRQSTSADRFHKSIRWWILALIGVMVALRALKDPTSANTLFWGGLFIAWLIFGARMLSWLTARFMSQALSKQDLSAHLGSQTLDVEPDGLHCTSGVGSSVIAWSAVKRVETKGDHTFIYVSDVSALVVPHRCATPEEVQAFIALVRERAAA